MCLSEAETSASHRESHRLPLATQETGGATAGQPGDRVEPKHQSVRSRGAQSPSVPLHQPSCLQTHQTQATKSVRSPAPTLSTWCKTPSSAFLPSTPSQFPSELGWTWELPASASSGFHLTECCSCPPVTSSYTPTFCPQDNQPDRTAP